MPRLALPLFFGLALALSWAMWWLLVAGHPGWGPPVTPDLHLLGSLGPAALLGADLLAARLFGEPWPSPGAVFREAESPHLGPLALILGEVVFCGDGEEIGWRGS